ncbi:hypothetical protein SADUNF_Sadunf18G0119700 [Salix dunnii]|uniref:Core-2/I-branching beta-1,6-N-acetylglucosaminyltransferase family protein n=1 Tax=Salix dunnii TaxID=1413687 RepID=A0A835MGT0_9ROSI|nr:hypothetical protein SADUNF_Sadunf18G0119700 [Salix dunnii]
MKTSQVWRLGMGDMQILPVARHRPPLRRPTWIIVLVSMVSLFLVCAYIYPPQSRNACYVFSSRGCQVLTDWLPPAPARELTDEEIASRVVIREILSASLTPTKKAKIAFMFLTPGPLPFEKLWDKFFSGHEDRFSVYVHASKEKPVHVSRYFVNQDIRSDQVIWGKISMIDAERRLLANALRDPDNQHFVLLSDSCVPLYKFDYIYHYLMFTNISYVDCFYDPGPHGNGRYSEHMLPEVEMKDFRKGAQWFSLKRQHALIVLADSLYYSKFRDYCKPGLEGKNCIADEHYLPTFFNMVDPGGIANWSVTHVDWSERKWHPKLYRSQDVTYDLLRNITVGLSSYLRVSFGIGGGMRLTPLGVEAVTSLLYSAGHYQYSINLSIHVTSDEKKEEQIQPCLWNGITRPCYLFARKFHKETIDDLLQLFSNYTAL